MKDSVKPLGKSAKLNMDNPVKKKLLAGKPTVGAWIESPNPATAEILAMQGFDWLVFDLEHGTYSMPQVQSMMQAMSRFSDCLPFVRVPINEPVYFKWALDMGARGIVVPMVNTKEEAERAVKSSKYPPWGTRGSGPRRASLYYSKVEEYIRRANDELLLVVMIETPKAIENLDSILTVKGIDAVFIGPDDLSLGLGIFKQRDHPKYKAALRAVLDSCKKHGVAPGIHSNESEIADAIAQGFRFVGLNDDDTFLQIGARYCLEKAKGWTH